MLGVSEGAELATSSGVELGVELTLGWSPGTSVGTELSDGAEVGEPLVVGPELGNSDGVMSNPNGLVEIEDGQRHPDVSAAIAGRRIGQFWLVNCWRHEKHTTMAWRHFGTITAGRIGFR